MCVCVCVCVFVCVCVCRFSFLRTCVRVHDLPSPVEHQSPRPLDMHLRTRCAHPTGFVCIACVRISTNAQCSYACLGESLCSHLPSHTAPATPPPHSASRSLELLGCVSEFQKLLHTVLAEIANLEIFVSRKIAQSCFWVRVLGLEPCQIAIFL